MAWKRDPVPWAQGKPTGKQRLRALLIGVLVTILVASLTLVIGGLVAATLAHFIRAYSN